MNRRMETPLGLKSLVPGHRQSVERFIEGPAGVGDDLSEDAIEIYSPGGGDASGAPASRLTNFIPHAR
jgi:hypothetical protein